jgi:hypothetical protein
MLIWAREKICYRIFEQTKDALATGKILQLRSFLDGIDVMCRGRVSAENVS